MYFALFLFMAWVLPLVGGTIVAMASMYQRSEAPGQIVFSLSPVAGIGTSAMGSTEPTLLKAMQAAAIFPPLAFTFVFNSLLISAHRRVLKQFAAATLKAAEPGGPEARLPEVLVPA